jgi:hypothetical protein
MFGTENLSMEHLGLARAVGLVGALSMRIHGAILREELSVKIR